MTGDPLDRKREILVRSLNDFPTQPNWAWGVLNTWDDLVEVARAARDQDAKLDRLAAGGHVFIRLEDARVDRAALARLEEDH